MEVKGLIPKNKNERKIIFAYPTNPRLMSSTAICEYVVTKMLYKLGSILG